MCDSKCQHLQWYYVDWLCRDEEYTVLNSPKNHTTLVHSHHPALHTCHINAFMINLQRSNVFFLMLRWTYAIVLLCYAYCAYVVIGKRMLTKLYNKQSLSASIVLLTTGSLSTPEEQWPLVCQPKCVNNKNKLGSRLNQYAPLCLYFYLSRGLSSKPIWHCMLCWLTL